MTQAELLPQIFKLSQPDQIMIVEAIRNHLAGGLAPVDETEFKAELDRRIDDAREHPENESPVDDVLRRVRARL